MFCVATAAGMLAIAAEGFSLSWSHSVEHMLWREEWVREGSRLRLVSASVQGSGAGIDPPEGAVLDHGTYTWTPTLAPVPELVLAASGATGGGWTLCAAGRCDEIGAAAEAPVTIRACDATAGGDR